MVTVRSRSKAANMWASSACGKAKLFILLVDIIIIIAYCTPNTIFDLTFLAPTGGNVVGSGWYINKAVECENAWKNNTHTDTYTRIA